MDKTKKVLLIFPNPISQPSWGLASVASVFIQNGYEVRILINTFRRYLGFNDIMDVVRSYSPDIVGLSFATLRILRIYELIKEIKKDNVMVICGGPHPTIQATEVLENGADIIVRGEGEVTVDELCKVFRDGDKGALKNILGISYRDEDGMMHHNRPRPRIEDLDSIPYPDMKLYDEELFRMKDGSLKAFNKVQIGRGCPFQCIFCDRSVWGNKFIHRSPESVIGQVIRLMQEYNFTDFWIEDDNLCLNKEYARHICDLIIQKNLNITWGCSTHINTADRDLFKKMKEAGCVEIVYGAESGDDDTLKRIRKGYTAKDIVEAVELAADVGIQIYVNLMTGFPWETPEHVENTIKLIKQIQPMVITFQCYGAAIPYPNTALYEEYKDEYGFENFWLKEKYQDAGQVIYENVENPYKVSSYFQRNLYDDTYVYEDMFFKFTPEYKKKVREMLFILGRHNLTAQYSSTFRQNWAYALGKISRFFYEINPNIERKLVSTFNFKNPVHENRGMAKFIKK